MTALTDFLFPAPARRGVLPILRWWEARRLRYNLLVGASGLASLVAVRLVTWLPPDPRTLLFDWRPVVVFGVLANVCYTLGPTVEIALHKLWGNTVLPAGPALFRMGLTFSVGLAFFPALLVGMDWAYRVLQALL